jgi:hypothetical protein
MVPLDSAHQIDIEIIFYGILTAFGSCCSDKDVSCHIFSEVF